MTWTVPDQGEPANDLQSELFQSSLDGLVAGFARTGVITGCAVAQRAAGADMSVDVAAGTITLAGAQASVTAGNVSIGAADATNPRLDLIVVNGSGTKSVIAGTAAAAPKEATLDTTTYVVLAQVYVPATATTITTARITDRRVIIAPAGPRLTPPRSLQSGVWTHAIPLNGSGSANLNIGTAFMEAVPFMPASSVTLNGIAMTVNVAAATAIFRLGIYADNGTGYPGSLIQEFTSGGTIDASTTGDKSLTISQALTGDTLYWLTYVCQTATAQLKGASPTYGFMGNRSLSDASTMQVRFTWVTPTGSVTGAMPATFPTTQTGGSNAAGVLYVKAA